MKENRSHPRLKLATPLPCLFTLAAINGVPASALKHAQAQITDLGEGGLRIATGLALPVQKNIVITLSFSVRNFQVQRKARLVHHLDGALSTYGVQFLDNDNVAEIIRLQRVMRILQAEQQATRQAMLNRAGFNPVRKGMQ